MFARSISPYVTIACTPHEGLSNGGVHYGVDGQRSPIAPNLAMALRALLVVWRVTCLIEAGDEADAGNGNWINRDPERKLELLSFAVIGAGSEL